MSAVAATMDGAGPVSKVAAELKELEAAMADPERMDELDKLIERFGVVQGRYEELGGYALEGRAREILAGLGFTQEMMDGDVGALSGGWKMRVALARILLMRPDAMLLDEPSNHLDIESLIWLENFLKGYEGALLMTSHDREFMNRDRHEDHRDRRRLADDVLGQLRLLREAARPERAPAAGAVRAPAGHARQGAEVHRALQGPSLARGPGAEPREEAGEDREGGAAQAPPDAALRVPAAAALGRRRGQAGARGEGLRQAPHLRRAGLPGAPGRALVRDGRERRGQVHAAQARLRRVPPG